MSKSHDNTGYWASIALAALGWIGMNQYFTTRNSPTDAELEAATRNAVIEADLHNMAFGVQDNGACPGISNRYARGQFFLAQDGQGASVAGVVCASKHPAARTLTVKAGPKV